MVRDWSREKRTALEFIADEIARRFGCERGARARAARALGMQPNHFKVWFLDEKRGLSPENTRKVARFFGLPFECVVFRSSPIRDVVRGSVCSCCRAWRRNGEPHRTRPNARQKRRIALRGEP